MPIMIERSPFYEKKLEWWKFFKENKYKDLIKSAQEKHA